MTALGGAYKDLRFLHGKGKSTLNRLKVGDELRFFQC